MALATGDNPRIKTSILLGGCFLLAYVISKPLLNGVSPIHPWVLARHNLMLCVPTVTRYFETNNEWPTHYSEIVEFAAEQKLLFPPFIDPHDGSEKEWILVPIHDRPVGKEHIILAAPALGGYRVEHSGKRLILFESGKADWISEDEFLNITGKTGSGNGGSVQLLDKLNR